MNVQPASGSPGCDAGTFLALLERLIQVALGDEGVSTLVVRDGGWYRVSVSLLPASTSTLLEADTHAAFSFTPERIRDLAFLGVTTPDMVRSAFGDMLEQLAAHATNKTALMRVVYSRLAAAYATRPGDTV